MRRTLPVAALVLLAPLVGSCGWHESVDRPQSLCGTPVGAELSGLLPGPRKISERTSAGFREPGASWCIVSAGDEKTLSLWFARGGAAPDLMELARNSGVVGLVAPRPVQGIGQQAAVGRDGALATTRCRDAAGGTHFTLGIKFHRGAATTANRERDVERFMRAYMPATVKSLNCLPR
ncbi:hypothetical protein [Streptomyces sp. NPDC047130]|uniref:hypothetical protein n=1 Tax=Streptomyces sp. NPDC047130 TaxID=3155261 RepID=UPI0033F9E06D